MIKKLAVRRELREHDCFVMAVLSHGDGADMKFNVEFIDGGTFDVEEILIQFNNLNCKELVKIPKIFLFPFCR